MFNNNDLHIMDSGSHNIKSVRSISQLYGNSTITMPKFHDNGGSHLDLTFRTPYSGSEIIEGTDGFGFEPNIAKHIQDARKFYSPDLRRVVG